MVKCSTVQVNARLESTELSRIIMSEMLKNYRVVCMETASAEEAERAVLRNEYIFHTSCK